MNAPQEARKKTSLGLEPGKPIELLFEYPAKVQLKLQLIGYDVGRYIILKSPSNNDYNDVLVEGNVVGARFLLEGEKGLFCAFKSTIRNVTKFPDRFIILEYPNKIAQQHLRKHQRITVHLPAKIDFEDGKQPESLLGLVADICPLGCALEVDRADIKGNPKKKYIKLEVFHPTGELIVLNAFVCNARAEEDKVFMGVSFIDVEDKVEDLLKHLLICTAM